MSYIRLKLKDAEKYEYFDYAHQFAKRYRLLIANKIKIENIQKIECHFCYSQSSYGIKELLREGEPLKEGYIIIDKFYSESPYYSTGQFFSRDKKRARIFSAEEKDHIMIGNLKKLHSEYVS